MADHLINRYSLFYNENQKKKELNDIIPYLNMLFKDNAEELRNWRINNHGVMSTRKGRIEHEQKMLFFLYKITKFLEFSELTEAIDYVASRYQEHFHGRELLLTF